MGFFQVRRNCPQSVLKENCVLKNDKLQLANVNWLYVSKDYEINFAPLGKEDPLRDQQFNITPGLLDLILGAFHGMVKRVGNPVY